MRFGENNKNLTSEELEAGRKAARSLSRNLKKILGQEFQLSSPSVMNANTGASAKMKYHALDRIVLKSSSVSFIQNYGFEGIKSNGRAMRLKPVDHFNKLLNNNRALETLATEVANLRAEEVTAKIKI